MIKQLNIAVRVILPLLLISVAGYLVWFFSQLPITVPALVETTPVPHASDAAEDSCIWLHPTDPSQSLVLGSDKDGGIGMYGLDGEQLDFVEQGRIQGIDLRYNFPLDDERITIVIASNRSGQCIDCFKIIPETRKLVQVGRIPVGGDLGGCCMYFSQPEQSYYCFVTSPLGKVKQFLLEGNRIGDVTGTFLRELNFDTATDACVADDELGFLYVAEEKEGVWKVFADPGVNDSWRAQVCKVDEMGKIRPDAEGLAIYYGSDRTGYLLLSSKGNSSFALFERGGKNEYVTSFAVGPGVIADGVTNTDGIDVMSFPLGSSFPQGMFVVQDDFNDDGNQNFKLVSWGAIAQATEEPLIIDISWDPRKVGLAKF